MELPIPEVREYYMTAVTNDTNRDGLTLDMFSESNF
jgi:hypothetical protein